MNKKFIPSLIIFFKGFVITCLGIAFHFTKIESEISIPLIVIGSVLIFASLIVLLIMNSIEAKKK